jgi:hypothetical protein
MADMAHQAILVREQISGHEDSGDGSVTNEIVKEFESEPFLGPNSIVISRNGGIPH